MEHCQKVDNIKALQDKCEEAQGGQHNKSS